MLWCHKTRPYSLHWSLTSTVSTVELCGITTLFGIFFLGKQTIKSRENYRLSLIFKWLKAPLQFRTQQCLFLMISLFNWLNFLSCRVSTHTELLLLSFCNFKPQKVRFSSPRFLGFFAFFHNSELEKQFVITCEVVWAQNYEHGNNKLQKLLTFHIFKMPASLFKLATGYGILI